MPNIGGKKHNKENILKEAAQKASDAARDLYAKREIIQDDVSKFDLILTDFSLVLSCDV